jgi:serine/threonine-protein kinase
VTLHAGVRLGAYEILAPLGAGGMGEVWRARDTRLKRDVAIKVLPDALAGDPVAQARFDREAKAVAALSHPNILDVHDVGAEGGVSWVVTELLEGETLKEKLDGGPVPWRRAVEIGLALAEGLGAAHARGVVHRDIKPSNVFLTTDGRVKILDFGIATLEESGAVTAVSSDLSAPQALVGTAGYLSPEQIRRERADARSDIFSLGCVLYEMTTGRRTFTGDTPTEALFATLRAEPKDPADLVPELPEDLRRLVLRCLEKRPERRFQTAADLAFALRAPLESSARTPAPVPPVPTPVPPVPDPARRPWRAALAAAVAVLALAAAFFLMRTRAAALDSLAVLPFANETGDPANDYLSEGVTSSLIDALSRTPSLTVLAHASVSRYGGDREPRAAGRTLKVKAILTGRLRRKDRDVHVDAELVNALDGSHLWAGSVTDHAGDSVPAAADLAPKIARALRPSLTVEQVRHVSGRSHDPEAWDRVQRGRFFLNRRSEEGYGKAQAFFEEAAARDPREAEAWRGLAEVAYLLAYYGAAAPSTLLPRQREFASRAIALDPTLSGPHAILADARYVYDHDWPGAEEEFRRALDLNPSDALARQWYSNFLTAASRHDESLNEISRARALDPLNPVIQMDAGLARYFAGDAAAAVTEIRSAIEMDPSNPLPRLMVSLPLFALSRPEEAVQDLDKVREAAPGLPEAVAFRGYAGALAGRAGDVSSARQTLDTLAKERYVSGLSFAILALADRKHSEALDWLEKAAAEGEGRLTYLQVERAFDPIREEPRFHSLVGRLAIPPRRGR